jgi:uncharacterized protein
MIQRKQLRAAVADALARGRIVALIGPRQSGKTTLARTFVDPSAAHYFDLEDPRSAQRLAEPVLALERLTGLVVIDEVQRMPDLFPILRVLADRDPLPAKFLVLGSAAMDWMRQSSESLAGRIEVIEMSGFTRAEVGDGHDIDHWSRGGMPRSFLAATDADSLIWRNQFMNAVIERDLPILGINASAPVLQRFWRMLAHYHAQTLNVSELATALQISQRHVRLYLDALEGVHMVRRLQPWHENMGKRQVKSPKIYIRDSGLYHALMDIETPERLFSHPKVGASWEGYALETLISAFSLRQVYFWGSTGGAELDLFSPLGNRRIGFEIKHVDAPKLTRSIQIALADLKLDHLFVVYPGPHRYPIAERVEAIPLAQLTSADFRLDLDIV